MKDVRTERTRAFASAWSKVVDIPDVVLQVAQ